jgi:hypothetical protein
MSILPAADRTLEQVYDVFARLLLNRYYDDLFARIDTLLTYEEYDMLLEHWIAARDGKAPPDVQAIADRVNADPVAGPLLKRLATTMSCSAAPGGRAAYYRRKRNDETGQTDH